MRQGCQDPRQVRLYMEALYHQTQGNRSGALLAYRRLQRQFPDFADGWTSGSAVLSELGRSDEALASALRGLELDPKDPGAHNAAGNALMGLGRTDEAAGHFRSAVALDPSYSPSLTNLAGIHVRRGEFREGLELGGRAIEACPSSSAAWGNRGHARMRTMDLAGAEADLRRALELDADNRMARWTLAYLQLLQGRFQEAWPNFAVRVELDGWQGSRPPLGRPRWKGEALRGRTLLVHTEQGFGDTLQFSRFLPRLKVYGGRVVLAAYRELERVMAGVPGVDAVAVEGGPLPDFDLAVPIMELPVILDAGPEDLAPLPPPELPPAPRIPELDRPGLRVGLVWAGSPAHGNDAFRSMDPAFLRTLADVQGAEKIAWYGLQKPPAPGPPDLPGFLDLSRHMGDFLDTAQVARQMDLVVTVDTSVAHLAGFYGLPAIVMLAYMPDWRWGLGGATPWYPTLGLVRQPAHCDWAGALESLKAELAGRLAPAR